MNMSTWSMGLCGWVLWSTLGFIFLHVSLVRRIQKNRKDINLIARNPAKARKMIKFNRHQ